MEIKKKTDPTGKVPNSWKYDSTRKSEGHKPLYAEIYKDLYCRLYK